MKKWAMATAAIAVVGGIPMIADAQTERPQIAEQCLDELRAFDDEVTELRLGEEDATGAVVAGRDFRQLREAARVFANNGNADACQMIVLEMRALYEQRQVQMSETAAEGEAEMQVDEEHGRLAAAVAIDQRSGLIRSSDLVGIEVRNPNDEYLGEIETVVLDPHENQVAYVLLAHGGFLGIGEDWIPIRWGDLRVTEDGDTYVLDIAVSEIENAPTINAEVFNPEAGEDWRSQINSWWDEATGG